MKRGHLGQRVIALLCVGMLASGCYGPFNLTRRLHNWNGQVGSRWANEIVFLAFLIIPVYKVATLADGLVFNSIEFWTGNNPIAPPGSASAPMTKTLAQGDQAVILQRTDSATGRQMHVQVKQGDRVVQEVSFEASLDGPTLVKDAHGTVVGSAQTLPDGTLVVFNADGREQMRYSPQQLERLAKKYSAAAARQ